MQATFEPANVAITQHNEVTTGGTDLEILENLIRLMDEPSRAIPPQRHENPNGSLDAKIRLISLIQKEQNLSNQQIKHMRRILRR